MTGEETNQASDTPIEKYVEKGARGIKPADIQKVVERSREIRGRFTGRGPLGRFVEDGRLLVSLVRDYWKRNYRQVPYGMIAAAAFALLYVFNPFDIVPDFLPLLGEVDDAAVITACLLAIEGDLHKYREWRQARQPALESAPGIQLTTKDTKDS